MLNKIGASITFLIGLFAFWFKRKADQQESKANRLQNEVNQANTIHQASDKIETEREKIKEQHRQEDINADSNNRRDDLNNNW